ncbi:hypothetical protein RKE38_03870 [Phycicoccus sp. M110.8]|uniref:hypothetical protein n=1 Tax=Phycicoccus sp. M110.8 TaxID=3075433 RepID=UPI0028FDAA1E|nr:hypothetical protein [Phycicoccus sp. M110.8]MDU0312812.1 hypothetical protein [Phycicoccus sp. M110.8]
MRARRLPVADRVDRDGESVVLVGREVVRLSALATALLDECWDWAEEERLVAVLVDRFGPPPDGGDPAVLVEEALATLSEHRLVERG